jgi:hypothetical protein
VRESYVSPVTRASEPRSAAAAVWRFRVVALVLLVVIGAGFAWGINKVMHLGDQDPTSTEGPVEGTGP